MALSSAGSLPVIASSPTLELESNVFEFPIKRTSEPLSLFNFLPPPLPLDEVLQTKRGLITTKTLPRLSDSTLPTTGSKLRLSNTPTSGMVVRAKVSGHVVEKASGTTESATPVNRQKAVAASSAQPSSPSVAIAPTSKPVPSPVAPVFRQYPDTLVLVGGTRISCKVLGDTDEGLRVELSSGIIVEMPSRRIISRSDPGNSSSRK